MDVWLKFLSEKFISGYQILSGKMLLINLIVLAILFLFRVRFRLWKKWRKWLAFFFPKRIYGHRSFYIDLGSAALFVFFEGIVIIYFMPETYKSLGEMQRIRQMYAELNFGGELALAAKNLLLTITYILFADFAAYWYHRAMHSVRFLWEFHKVHHSAMHLTPVTTLRNHPLEGLLIEFMRLGSLMFFVMIVYRVFDQPVLITLSAVGLFLVPFRLIINLRHTHIRLGYSPFWSKIFCSPFMHQIHHSHLTPHLDKNFTIFFSLWDYFFGTLYIPKRNEEVKLGLTNVTETAEFNRSIVAGVVLPLKNIKQNIKLGPSAKTYLAPFQSRKLDK